MIHRTVLFAAFVGTVLLANWLASTFGQVPAGFGLVVVAGTYAAGLALGLRDALHDAAGVRWVLAAIATGALLSFAVADPLIALASGAAFTVSELSDLLVYAPLRRKRPRTAVVLSNTIGSAVDTWLFLWLAPFPITLAAFGGQMLVKAIWVTGAYLLVRESFLRIRKVVRRSALSGQRLQPEGA